MKYYKAIENIALPDGGIIPKGSVVSEITYDLKDPAIQVLFEDDTETTHDLLPDEPPPTSPPEADEEAPEGTVFYNPPPKKWNLPYADDTDYSDQQSAGLEGTKASSKSQQAELNY